jgi:hypothetical protein
MVECYSTGTAELVSCTAGDECSYSIAISFQSTDLTQNRASFCQSNRKGEHGDLAEEINSARKN